MWKRGNKRGLSDVVTTLIIILLSLVAIGIVWVVVQNLLSEGTDEIGLEQFTIDIDFVSASINGDEVTMTVRRTAGQGNMTGMKFILSDGLNSEEFTEEGGLTALQIRTFTVVLASLDSASLETVAVAPIYNSGSNERVGSVTDTYNFGSGSSGNGNGGGTGNPNTGTCGDGIIQNPNADNPAINEQCDLTNLGNPVATCMSQGFASGTLSCTAGCQFDTSQCTLGVPSSCDGTWNQTDIDDGNECDAGANCQLDCMCPVGYTADGTGGCSLNPAVNNGSINTVWNSIYFDSNDLPKSPATMTSYINYYVNFSNSPEIACFQITFADYVADTDISYLRLDDSLGFPNIASGENYHVWEAMNCGQ